MNRPKPGAPSVTPALPDLLAVLDQAQHPAPASLLAEVDQVMAQAAALGMTVSPVQAVLAVQATAAAAEANQPSPAVKQEAPLSKPVSLKRTWWQTAGAVGLGLLALGCLVGFGHTVWHAHFQTLAGDLVNLKEVDRAMGIWILSSAFSTIGAVVFWYLREIFEGVQVVRTEAEETIGAGPWIRVK